MASATGYTVKRYTNNTDAGNDTNGTTLTCADASVSECVSAELSAGTTYYYRVSASNVGGSSALAAAQSALTYPATPTGVGSVADSQTEISLDWDDMAGASSYTVKRYANNIDAGNDDNGTTLTCANAAASECVSDGLVADTTYYYRVSASNASGASALSTAVSSTTYPNAPSTPTNLEATPVSQTEIDLDWDDMAGATSYTVKRYADNTDAGNDANGTTLTCADAAVSECVSADLTLNTIYYYRVRASNAGGSSALATAVSATTHPNAPSAPSDLVATADGADTIDLTWTDNADNETGFRIERSEGDDENFEQIDTAAANATSYSDSSCDPETTYYYRVRAYNAGGNSAYSNIDSDTTEEAPTGSCLNTTTIGAVCTEGGLYAGTYNGYTYMTTGSNCNNSTTPTCDEHATPASRAADTLNRTFGNTALTHNASSTVDGVSNVEEIFAAEGTDSDAQAAWFCDQMTYAGYSDWFLPAKDEIDAVLEDNKADLGGFAGAYYWSSTEHNSNIAWSQYFADGTHHTNAKSGSARVRCVRRF